MSSTTPPANLNSQPASSFALGIGSQTRQDAPVGSFVDRRSQADTSGQSERRQFGSSHDGLSQAGRELAFAIDQYKLQHHRRYITCDEMLLVMNQLGYRKQTS